MRQRRNRCSCSGPFEARLCPALRSECLLGLATKPTLAQAVECGLQFLAAQRPMCEVLPPGDPEQCKFCVLDVKGYYVYFLGDPALGGTLQTPC